MAETVRAGATDAPRSSRFPGSRRARRRRRSPLATAVIAAGLVGALLPLAYLLSISLMSRAEISAGELLPPSPAWGNWAAAWTLTGLPRAILNSTLAALGGAALALACALPASWLMLRYRTGGRALAATVLAPWLLPPIVAVIPLLGLLRVLGLTNTLPGLVLVYGLANTAVAVWLLRGFLARIPVEIEEAAALDGAGTLRILTLIILPLMRPGLLAVGVVLVVLNYHEFLFALFFTQGPDAQTVTVVLSLLFGDRMQDVGRLAAAALLAAAPLFLVAGVLQRGLLAGANAGARSDPLPRSRRARGSA